MRCLSCWLVLSIGWASAQDDVALDDAVQQAVKTIAPAVIRLDRIGGTGQADGNAVQRGPGTGLVVDSDGYLLTASWFLVDRPASILATLPDGGRCSATVVARDRSRNLALLKLELEPGQRVSVPSFAELDQVRVGQTVIAVGRGFDAATAQLSSGIVSATNRIWGKAIQTDANVSPANYGGPLVDLQGRVLGILVPLDPDDHTPLAGTQWYDSGIGFAATLDVVLDRIDQLKRGDDLLPGKLGATLRGGNPLSAPVVVDYCQGSSEAARQGLRPGDLIKFVDGQRTDQLNQFKHAIGPRYAGDVVKIQVDRSGESLSFSIPLVDQLPQFQPVAIGARVQMQEGVAIITDVLAGSPAAASGLSPGDQLETTNEQPVTGLDRLRLALGAIPPGQRLSLGVKRGETKQQIDVKVEAATGDLPEQPVAGDRVDGLATAERFQIADAAKPAFLILPPETGQPIPLLVWLPPAGRADFEAMGNRWKEVSRDHGIAVLVFGSAQPRQWDPQQRAVILRAIDTLGTQRKLDRGRIAIGGQKTGGVLASRIAFENQTLFSGLVLSEASLSESIEGITNRPTNPFQVVLTGEQPRRSESYQKLTENLVPVVTMERIEAPEIARWIGWLDRL